MYKVATLVAIAAIIISFSSTSRAGLIMETYEATVASSTDSVFSVGDKVSWSVTFDDTSSRMHRYNDGSNGIAEAGANDDTVAYIWCTATDSDQSSCSETPPLASLLADAVFDLSEFYDPLAAAGLTGFDARGINGAHRYSTFDGSVYANNAFDDVEFTKGLDGTGVGHMVTYYGQSHYEGYSHVSFSSALQSVSSVPEPGVIVLMVTGLAGMSLVRRRRRS